MTPTPGQEDDLLSDLYLFALQRTAERFLCATKPVQSDLKRTLENVNDLVASAAQSETPLNTGKKQEVGRNTERLIIAGEELIDYVKGLIETGKVRRLVILKASGDVLLNVPLIAGIAVVGALTLFVPLLTALGAIAALVARIQVNIVRSANDR